MSHNPAGVQLGSLVSAAAFAYADVMYATAVVGGKVVRFKLSRALARAHRAVALASSEATERTSLFERALELHSGSPDLFEEARTRLAYGATLRRSRSRVAARPQLRLALEAFERLGARSST